MFDNVVSAKAIRPFWPFSSKGDIVLTSQRPEFLGAVNVQIKIPPMSNDEGTELFRRYLRRDVVDSGNIQTLTSELGGLPLAITHYAGYISISQMSVTEILASFQQRQHTAEIWSCHSNASMLQYERTLDTVWDFALDNLPDDARNLLDILSLLNPDAISEEMLLAYDGAVEARPGLSRGFS